MDIRIYEGWDGDYWNGGDIVMIKLDREAELSLPKWNDDPDSLGQGLELIALGWGKRGKSAAPHTLHMTKTVDYVAFKQCSKIWDQSSKGDPRQLPLGVLCAGDGSSDTCKGLTHAATNL